MVEVSNARTVSVAARTADRAPLRKPEGALPTVTDTSTIGARCSFMFDNTRGWMFAMGPWFESRVNSIARRGHYHGGVACHCNKQCACDENLLKHDEEKEQGSLLAVHTDPFGGHTRCKISSGVGGGKASTTLALQTTNAPKPSMGGG